MSLPTSWLAPFFGRLWSVSGAYLAFMSVGAVVALVVEKELFHAVTVFSEVACTLWWLEMACGVVYEFGHLCDFGSLVG